MKNSLSYKIPNDWEDKLGALSEALLPLITEKRISRMEATLNLRKRGVLCLFENTHHCHNISAVLRTMEALGYLESVFIYDNPQMKFKKKDSVERGSSQWLLTRRASNIDTVAATLKEAGYLIALVSLPSFSLTSETFLSDLPQFSSDQIDTEGFENFAQSKPIALVLGSELNGISSKWAKSADFYLHVSMEGFVESLNVSVCAGMILHNLRHYCKKHENLALNNREKTLILEHWICKSVKNATLYVDSQHPSLSSYFHFMKAGKFFDPFPEDHKESL